MPLMMIYFDWFGTTEDLQKVAKATEKAAGEIEGIEYKGLYVPHQPRYHYSWVFKAESYEKYGAVNRRVQELSGARDRNVMTHASVQVLSKVNW